MPNLQVKDGAIVINDFQDNQQKAYGTLTDQVTLAKQYIPSVYSLVLEGGQFMAICGLT